MKKPIVMMSLENGWAVRMAKRYVKPGTPGAVQGTRGGWYVDVKGRKPGAAKAWRPAKAKPGAPLEDDTSLLDGLMAQGEVSAEDLAEYNDPSASLTAAVAKAGKGQPDSIGINDPPVVKDRFAKALPGSPEAEEDAEAERWYQSEQARTAKTKPSLSRADRAATEIKKRFPQSGDLASTKEAMSKVGELSPAKRRYMKRRPEMGGKAKRALKLALQPTANLSFLSPQPKRFV